jgi:tRNA (cmo5U34)-methyltransferase
MSDDLGEGLDDADSLREGTMDLQRVRAHFDEEATDYDARILRIVPQYREQGELILEVLPFDTDRPLRALDLGCGTGALSCLLLAAYPAATIVACDLSQNMLALSGRRLARFAPRATFRQADFGSCDLGADEYDVVLSGLAIHHLDGAGTRALYRRIHRALRPGGMFVNRELVLGATPYWTRRYEQLWREHVTLSGETDQGWFQQYLDEDQPVSIEDHLTWLRAAAFVEVACHFRRLNFAIFGGSKPGDAPAGGNVSAAT